jgi:hypothetical protein
MQSAVRTSLIIFSICLSLLVTSPVSASRVNPRPWYYAIAHSTPKTWARFTCVIKHESGSTWAHPNLGDNNRYGSSGIFQVEDATWLARSGMKMHIWQASPREQAIGALRIEQSDSFAPWSLYDGC